MKYEITGGDITVTKFVPVNGVIHYGGAIKSPFQLIKINWKEGFSLGETICESDYGQYEIDCLVKSGCTILSVELY